jgi:hypothetical protein
LIKLTIVSWITAMPRHITCQKKCTGVLGSDFRHERATWSGGGGDGLARIGKAHVTVNDENERVSESCIGDVAGIRRRYCGCCGRDCRIGLGPKGVAVERERE